MSLTEQVKHRGLSRRNFLQGAWKLTKTGLFLGTGGGLLVNWGLDVPPVADDDISSYPQPNWLYSAYGKNRPPLLNSRNGNEAFIRYYAMKDAVVGTALRNCFNEFFSSLSPQPRIGTILERHIIHAHDALSKAHPVRPTLENILLIASITYAGVLSNYFTLDDLANMGVETRNIVPIKGNVWMSDLFQKASPHVYPVAKTLCASDLDRRTRCVRVDGAIHVAQHLSLMTVYTHARIHGLGEADRIPNIARLIVRANPTILDEAVSLSIQAGEFKELDQTITSAFLNNGLRDENGIPIPTGKGDQLVGLDYKANELGREAAKILNYDLVADPLTEDKVHAAIIYLNDPSIYTLQDN